MEELEQGKLKKLEPYTKLRILEIMIVETKNALTRAKITEILLQKTEMREKLKGRDTKITAQALAIEQIKIRSYISAITDLQEIYSDLLAKEEDTSDT